MMVLETMAAAHVLMTMARACAVEMEHANDESLMEPTGMKMAMAAMAKAHAVAEMVTAEAHLTAMSATMVEAEPETAVTEAAHVASAAMAKAEMRMPHAALTETAVTRGSDES